MDVRFKESISIDGVLVAVLGDTAHVTSIIQNTYHLTLSAPHSEKYPAIVCDGRFLEVIKTPTTQHAGPGFIIKKVGIEDIDLTAFTALKEDCGALDGVNAIDAVSKALAAAAVLGKLMEYKSLLSFTVTEQERETKLHYARVLSETKESSQDKREAKAKQDDKYQELLTKLAQLKAFEGYINDAYNYADRMHYFFREVYKGELRVPDPGSRGYAT